MTDIIENLCQATDILIENKLKSLAFDITIEATVVDTRNASDGRYIVSNGNTSFEAYSNIETNYNVNDIVLVNIPQGDYDNQKNIISKKADNVETSMTFKSPFENFIDISNNLISGQHYISMQANGKDQYSWDVNTPSFIDSQAFKIIKNLNNDRNNNRITEEEFQTKLKTETCLIWNSETDYNGKLFESKYTKLGIKMQVSTWLNEYDTVSGNFGLMVVLMLQANNSEDSFPVFIPFDSDEFFGNVYNFETYYSQELLVDISEYINFPIKQILLFAYQRDNFKNILGEKIETKSNQEGFYSNSLPENIFIKDPYLCLGRTRDDFEEDSIEIITKSPKEYDTDLKGLSAAERLYNNRKVLGLRWIHKDLNTNEIKKVLTNEIPQDYHIYWYRYKIGAPSPDQFAGPNWERFYGAKNPFTTDGEGKIIQSLINDKEEYNLTSLDIKEGNENGYVDIATDLIDNIIFYPNINRQTEQIKAIIVKEENNLNVFSNNQEEKIKRLICSSEIELFENNSEVRNEITFIDTNALSIRFNDEEKGNYFLYNRAGLVSKEKDKEVKTLTAVFDNSGEQNDVYQKKELEPPYTSIKWSFPASQTMIIPATNKNESAEKLTLDNLDVAETNYEADEVTYNEIEDTYDFKFSIIMNKNGTKKSKEASLLSSIGYFINPKLSREANRNTVYLEINKDGQIYTASVKMNFGTAGTSGSDYTLTILWDNNDNAFDISKGILSGQVYIYDQSGQKIELEEESSYSFEWYKVRAVNDNTEREFLPKKETKDLYYPIANKAVKSLLWNGENYCKLKNNEHQKNNIKYLVDNENSNLQTFYYDVKEKTFKQVDINNNNNNYILYRKLNSNESRGILNFKAFDEVQFNSNKSGQMEKTNKGKMIYYYDSIRRAFIKYNDCFIIDPWNEYSSTETYYYPVYSSEQNYQSEENLKISYDEKNDRKGHFSIQTTENTKLNIETDLYILEVRLTHFGDYDLIARFPIPLKNGDSNHNELGQSKFKSYIIDYIEGPTEVRYSTSGERDFNKNPYQIVFRYLTRHPIETYQKAIEKYKEQVEDLFEKYQNEDNFKEELTKIKNSVENLVLLTQDPKSEYTKILLNIEKIKFQQLMDEYNNLQNSSITSSNLTNKYNEYKNNIDKIEQEYETSINNFKSSPRYTLLYENPNDLLKNSDQFIKEIQNNYDKTTFITYQQKRQGYKETELNVDEIVGHWELVGEENNDFTFLNESNDIDFKDFIDFQLIGENGTADQPEKTSLYGIKNILENINNKLENNINDLEVLKENINDKISSYEYNIRYIEKVCDKEIGQIEEKIGKTNDEKTKIKLEKKIQLKIEKKDKKIQNLQDKINFYERKRNELNAQNYQEFNISAFQEENNTFLNKINQEITRLEELKNQHYFIKPYLNPSEIYFKDELIYGVKFVLDENILSYLDENLAQLQRYEIDPDSGQYIIIPRGTTLWSQPIYVYQDNYPSTTLNKWNGKGITTDENAGIISANGFSAGKKENDNTFTGVVLGDWSRTDSDVMLTKQTGVFGFNHGAMSYALKDDGTAFFGKDGKGRIYFNGNKAQIYSANWISSIPKESDLGKYTQAKQGMMLDIDDGQLLINGLDQQKIIIAENGVSFSCLSSYNNTQINLLKLEFNSFAFENSNSKRPSFYLQSVDYHKAKRYSVPIKDNKTESRYAPGGGIKFDLSEGEIDAYKLKLQIGQKLNYNSTTFLSYFLTINTNQNDFFKINNGAFTINKTGKVTCKKQFIVKSEIKGDGWDKNKIKNNIRITEEGALTTKDSITSWGNLIVKSNATGGKNWDKNKIKNNIRITKDGNLTTKKNLKCWGNLYLYFNGNKSGFKQGLHKIKLKNINGNMVLVASEEIY